MSTPTFTHSRASPCDMEIVGLFIPHGSVDPTRCPPALSLPRYGTVRWCQGKTHTVRLPRSLDAPPPPRPVAVNPYWLEAYTWIRRGIGTVLVSGP